MSEQQAGLPVGARQHVRDGSSVGRELNVLNTGNFGEADERQRARALRDGPHAKRQDRKGERAYGEADMPSVHCASE
jgi:hypothetical protein